MYGSGAVSCSCSLLIRGPNLARCQAEAPLIALCRFPKPALFSRSAMTGPSVWPSYGLPCSALACSTNCPPLGAVTGVAIETLQPELVWRPRLATADALHLGRVQRVDLWPALTLLLMPNTKRECQQRGHTGFDAH